MTHLIAKTLPGALFSSSIAYRCALPGVVWQGCGVDNAPPPNAEVKNEWSHTSAPTQSVSVAMTGGTLPLLRVSSFGAQWLKIKLGGEICEYVLSSFERVYLARCILVGYCGLSGYLAAWFRFSQCATG